MSTTTGPNGGSVQGKLLVLGLAVVLAADGVFDQLATGWVRDDLERLRLPYALHTAFLPIKAGAAAGLLLGLRRRSLGRLTSVLLLVYFVLALGAHVRVKDPLVRHLPAVGMLLWTVSVLGTFRGSTHDNNLAVADHRHAFA